MLYDAEGELRQLSDAKLNFYSIEVAKTDFAEIRKHNTHVLFSHKYPQFSNECQ